MSLLVICEMLGLFVNILIVDNKYPLGYREILSQTISNAVSYLRNKNIFVVTFLKSKLKLEHFEKEGDLHSSYIFGITV